jgi:predicted DNA-binding ribbon-helix-helix protein
VNTASIIRECVLPTTTVEVTVARYIDALTGNQDLAQMCPSSNPQNLHNPFSPGDPSAPAGLPLGAMKKRSVVITGHRTSVSLENAFWDALKVIAGRKNFTVNQLVTEIDKQRNGNLSSAIRVYVLTSLQSDLASALSANAVSSTEPLQ